MTTKRCRCGCGGTLTAGQASGMQLYIKGHNPMHPMVHVRLPRDMVQAVDHLAIDRGTDRSETAAWLLRIALEAWQ